jgi:hypothetical protein
MGKSREKHSFSIEMQSTKYMKQISMQDLGQEPVLIQGFLGELEKISLVENILLEIQGENGFLRIDLTVDELGTLLPIKVKEEI